MAADNLEQRLERVESRQFDPNATGDQAPGHQSEHAAHYNIELHPSPVSGSHIFTSMDGPATAVSNGTVNTTSIDESSLVSGEIQNDPLAYSVVMELCGIWFQRYHRWFPILHQSTFMQVLDTPHLARLSDH